MHGCWNAHNRADLSKSVRDGWLHTWVIVDVLRAVHGALAAVRDVLTGTIGNTMTS